MYLPSTLVFAVVLVAAVLIYRGILRRRTERFHALQRETSRRQEEALCMNARVVRSSAGIYGEGGSQAKVSLAFEVLDGKKSYKAAAQWLVNLTALDSCSEGAVISVKVDLDDPQIIYPGASWAQFIPRK